MYDIFYVSKNVSNEDDWIKIKSKYPTAQKINNVKDYNQIISRAFTKMFWVIWDDLELLDSFNLLEYRATEWDDMYVHVFKNGDYFDGICLFPKNLKVSQREFEYRFFTEKKEINIQASTPKLYDKFYINNYDEYLEAIEKSTTEMFWVIWPDVIVKDSFKFDFRVPSYNTDIVHVFKNGDYFDGICLFPKNLKVSQREFEYRFFTEKKEINIQASTPKLYDKFYINNYDEYLEAIEKSTTEMFWVIWPEVEITNNEIFNLYYSYHNSYDRNENHVFKNLCNGQKSYYNGIVLFSKNKKISKREFERRYLIDKKEHDQILSMFRYPTYVLENYKQYLEILENETQPMLWGLWPEIEITDQSVFDLYFDPRDGKYDHDRNENHSFLHLFRNEKTYSNGAVLFSKNKKIGKREFDHRFLIEKKEHDILVSKMKPYDIVFISYNEPNADENYQRLLERFPRAKRVDKVKGIHQAHIKAAEISNTEMFWVVDGDAVIETEFNFDHEASTYERDVVHVWRSKNPVNGLVYGYGGVKLLPKKLTLEINIDASDMTTAISKKFKAMTAVSNITAFNTDPFNTWKSAFRECVKLSSKIIDRQNNDETEERLNVWCSLGKDQPFGDYAINGAIAGKKYGLSNKDKPTEIKKINDFQWLKEYYEQRTKNIHT
jgi:hypothetical protein